MELSTITEQAYNLLILLNPTVKITKILEGQYMNMLFMLEEVYYHG